MQPHWLLSISWQQVVKLRSEQGRRRKRRDKGKEEVDKDEEKKGRSGRKKEWQNWEKQRKEEERKCPQAQSVLSQSSPFPQVGEGPIEPCVGLGLHLPQAQNKEDTCLFPSRGIRGTERCFYFVFSSNPVHGHNRPKTFYVQELLQCMAHVAWLVIVLRGGQNPVGGGSWPANELD